MKRWLIILIVVGLLGGGVWLYGRLYGGEPVRVARVQQGTVRASIEEQAITSLPRVYELTMPAAGRLLPIELAPGSPVKEGEIVAQMNLRDLDLRLSQAESEVARLEASIRKNDDSSLENIGLKQAVNFVTAMEETVKAAAAQMTSGREKVAVTSRHRERIETLYEKNAASADQLDQAVLDEVESNVSYEQDRLVYNASRAIQTATEFLPTLVQQYIDNKKLERDVLSQQLEAAQAALEEAQIQRTRGEIASPVEGVVLERVVDNEQTLAAGTVIVRIGDLEQLRVEADLLTQEAVRVHPGDRVEIFGDAVGADAAQGVVATIYPTGFKKISSLGVEQQRVKVIIDFAHGELARLAKRQNLGVEYRVNARIITETHENVPWIPRTAVFRGAAGQWQAFAVRENQLELVTLELGLMNDEQVEVTSGLAPNEMVVYSPESHLTPGLRVQPEVAAE